ncbi:MAG TPA: ATP-binding protein [Chloroflexia bacterium]|nr:ATP-binding protein [Chloroflexia bacterium]
MEAEPRVNILLVDDRPENLLALEAILADLDQHLVRAHSGTEALKCLLQQEFAVILLDVQMPDMDGFELATLIRERAKSRHTPIIFLTAINKSDTHVFRGYSVGAVDYLLKPFAPEVLRSKVSVFVDLFQKTQEVERQLAEMQRLNRELDARNRAISALHLDIRQLAGAEAELRTEVLQWREAEETVRQAKEAADRANQAKSEFLSSVSHEFRTPLTAILGYAALLSKDTLSEKQRRYTEAIAKAGRHLLGLINEVLDITRVEVDRLAIVPEPVSVGAALEVIRYMVVPLAAERGITLQDEIGADAAPVLADPQRLRQVLLNLIANAVKYNRTGGTVTVFSTPAPDDRLRINVRDTGPGIPPEKLGRLFAPFDRLGLEHSGVEGTGLGLALSKRLTEAMGGVIGVDSVVGEGSTFWVELPRAPQPDAWPAGEVLTAPAPPPPA